MSLDAGDLGAWTFDAAIARARDQVAALDRAADDLASGRGSAVSPCGRVTAEVDSEGRLVVLRLTPAVTRLTPTRAGALIVGTVAGAAQNLDRRRHRIVADLIAQLGGGTSPNTRPARNCAGRQ